jgi:2-haloacid dehalogenase
MKHKVIAFDAYGTLFDVAAAVRRSATRLNGKDKELAALWRAKQLEYTWLRSLRNLFADFEQVTGEALSWSLDTLGLDKAALYQPLMELYRKLDAYPDAKATLAALKARGIKTAILSNGSIGMLQAAVDNAGLQDLLDAVLSVDEVRIFKPHVSVYALVGQRFACRADEVVFVSGNFWDVSAGSAYGFQGVWINRAQALPEPLPGQPQTVISELSELEQIV